MKLMIENKGDRAVTVRAVTPSEEDGNMPTFVQPGERTTFETDAFSIRADEVDEIGGASPEEAQAIDEAAGMETAKQLAEQGMAEADDPAAGSEA